MSDDINKNLTEGEKAAENSPEETKQISETDAEETEDFEFDLNTGDRLIEKGDKRHILAYSLIFIAAAALVSFICYNISVSSPVKTVIKAYNNTLNEMLSAESIFDTEGLKSLVSSSPTQTELSITYNGSDYAGSVFSRLEGSGLTINALYDPEAGEMGGTVDANAAGMPVNIAKYYADSENIYGCLPLFEKEWVKMPQSNIFSAYNASALSNHLGSLDFTEDFSLNVFNLYEVFNIKGSGAVMNEYLLSDNEAFDSLSENMSAIKINDTYTLENGKKAKGYSVILRGADIAAVLNGFADYAEEQNQYLPLAELLAPVLKLRGSDMTAEETAEYLSEINYGVFRDIASQIENEEYEFIIYVYNKKLVRAEAVFDLEFYEGEETACRLAVSYPSGKSITEKTVFELSPAEEGETSAMTLKAEITNDGDRAAVSVSGSTEFYYAPYEFSLEAEYSKSTSAYSLGINAVNSENSSDTIEFSSKGEIAQTADSFTFNTDETAFYTNGDLVLSAGADLSIIPLEEQIEKPEGEALNLFTENDDELMALVNEVKSGYSSLISLIYMLGLTG